MITMMRNIDQHWIKRRFYDFRNGHGTYLIYFISFMQFVIVSYSLYISGHPSLTAIFPTVYHWIVIFLATYLPAAILIGHLHLKKQLPTEAKQNTEANPFTYYASPGKELQYSLPAAIIGYEKQLQSMTMHNQLIDFYEKTFQAQGMMKWSKQDFAEIERLKSMAERLLKGESISEIAKGNGEQERLNR